MYNVEGYNLKYNLEEEELELDSDSEGLYPTVSYRGPLKLPLYRRDQPNTVTYQI
jgi:hypothetical protein